MTHSRKRIGLALALLGLTAGADGRAWAGVLVTDRTQLGGNDSIDWGQFGLFNPIPSGSSVTTSNGVVDTVSQRAGNGMELEQDLGFSGNFNRLDDLYYTGYYDGEYRGNRGPVTLTFDGPVFGAGTQIQANDPGDFTAFINAYDASGNVLDRFREDGTSNNDDDGSAIFIGVLDPTADIARITFGIISAPPGGSRADFAINLVSITTNVQAIPEPATVVLAGTGGLLGLVVTWLRRRRAAA